MLGNMMMGWGMDRFMMRRFEREYTIKEILFRLAKGTDSSKQIERNVKVALEYTDKMEKAIRREERLAELKHEYSDVVVRIKNLDKLILQAQKTLKENEAKYKHLMEAKVKDVNTTEIEYAKGTVNAGVRNMKELKEDMAKAKKRLADITDAWKKEGQKEKDLHEEED